MNILFISTENPIPPDHGHHIRTYHILKALARKHTLHFVGFTQDDSGFAHEDQLYEFCDTVRIFELHFRGWRQLALAVKNLFSAMPLIAQKYYQAAAAHYISEVISGHRIDALHIDMLHIAEYRRVAGDLPSILVNHNVESLRLKRWALLEQNPFLRIFLQFQNIKLRRYEQKTCQRFDKCMTVSDQDQSLLQQLCGNGDFVTIPNGVDIDYFAQNGESVKPNTLVWTGSMASPYNRDGVLYFCAEIWPLIKAQMAELTVTFVGGSPPADLQQEARQGTTFRCPGYVSDVRPYVAQAAVFIAPLRAGSGTKIKVLNAMAQGKAIVTTSIGAEGIDVTNGQELFIADLPREFADKIVYLLRHPNFAREMGQRARKRIEQKYDWKVLQRDIDLLYEQLGAFRHSE